MKISEESILRAELASGISREAVSEPSPILGGLTFVKSDKSTYRHVVRFLKPAKWE